MFFVGIFSSQLVMAVLYFSLFLYVFSAANAQELDINKHAITENVSVYKHEQITTSAKSEKCIFELIAEIKIKPDKKTKQFKALSCYPKIIKTRNLIFYSYHPEFSINSRPPPSL